MALVCVYMLCNHIKCVITSSSGSLKGNFQDREKMKLEKAIRAVYGRFFYRFPDGESAADVYDRITGTRLPLLSRSKQTNVVLAREEESRCYIYNSGNTGFRETLKADIDKGRFQPPGERNQNVNLVIVSHGLTIRVFLMRWYKWTVKQFEGLHNLGNGGMLVMEKGSGGRYCSNALKHRFECFYLLE